MASPQPNSMYEPTPRAGHQTIRVGNNVYMWAGEVDGIPEIHDSQVKRRFISCVEVFHSESGDWTSEPTSGVPPLGVNGYGCTALGDTLHFFGGWCYHGDCYHNSIHSLSTSSLHWVELSPTTSEGGAPMKKAYCGTVAFKDGEEDILYVVAGYGPTPSYHQPGAQYEAAIGGCVRCNEQHMFSLSKREWSSPNITGQPPPPCSYFSLTPVGERRAALFGGWNGSVSYSSDLFIVDLNRDTVDWTRINKPINRSVEWPESRCHHAITCVSGPLLVLVGGWSSRQLGTISDCWIGDLTTKQWKKLRSLPDSVAKRHFHSLSALQLSPRSVLLVIFGGWRRTLFSARLSQTVLIELILQEDGGQWVVGRILEGAALDDKIVYQQMYQEIIQYNGAAMVTNTFHELPPTEVAKSKLTVDEAVQVDSLTDVIQEYKAMLLASEEEQQEREQELQEELNATQHDSQEKAQKCSKLEDAMCDMQKKMVVSKHDYDQQQNLLEKLQQKVAKSKLTVDGEVQVDSLTDVIEECKAKLVASEEEQQELLQVIEQTKRMGYAKDLQISMLESDGQLKSTSPTLLKLKTMKGADGKPLKIVQKIAAHDNTTFGMCLLQDENGEEVTLLKKNHIQNGAESVTEAILLKWLKSDAPTRTYQHLIECLRQSELGALAELITTVVQAKATQF